MGLLVPQAHRPDKPLELGRPAREVGPDKGGLRDHALPRLLGRLLARLDHLEHLLLGDTPHLGQRHAELGRLLGALVLDLRRQRLGVGGARPVQQVRRDRVRRLLLGRRALDVALLVRLDRLPQLDLLVVPLLGVQLGPQPAQVLRILRRLVPLASGLLARAFFVVEATTMLLDGALDVLVLRLSGGKTVSLVLTRRDWEGSRTMTTASLVRDKCSGRRDCSW